MHVHDSHHAGNAYCNYPKQIVSGTVGTDIVAVTTGNSHHGTAT